MQIIDADRHRMIDLPGVGPCPRPVDIDTGVTGFKALKSLRIYRFDAGSRIAGESEEDEVWVIPLDGRIAISITGAHPLSADLAPAGPPALYMAPHHAYLLTPAATGHVAYARAAATGRVATHVSSASASDGAEHLAYALVDLAGGHDLPQDTGKERLIHVVKGQIAVGTQIVTASQTLALHAGEAPAVTSEGAAMVLMVSA